MAKYIKLDDAIEILKSLVLDENSEVECPDECNAMLIGNGGAIDRISAMPTIEVVRCKDCKFAHMTVNGECKYCDIWFPDEKTYMPGDYYCASAER